MIVSPFSPLPNPASLRRYGSRLSVGSSHSASSSFDHRGIKSEYGTSTNAYGAQEASAKYSSSTTDPARREGEKLAAYLWENYIEPFPFSHGIILLGAGHAFHAVAKLIPENDAVYRSLADIAGFISTQPIRPISSATNHAVSPWYREHSLVYVSEKHSVWKKANESGKVSKRYGQLLKSEGDVVNGMMIRYREEMMLWMDAMIRKQRDRHRAEYGNSEDEDEDRDDGVKGEKESDGDTIEDPAVGADGAGAMVNSNGVDGSVIHCRTSTTFSSAAVER